MTGPFGAMKSVKRHWIGELFAEEKQSDLCHGGLTQAAVDGLSLELDYNFVAS